MSNSADVGGVGRRSSAEKSGFSLTCSLLSQYLKEKGSFGDLNLGMQARALDGKAAGKPETLRTMNLLPSMEISGDAAVNKDGVSDRKVAKSMDLFPQCGGFGPSAPLENAPTKSDVREPLPRQMTIFYGGKVLVFDNFPADKASELMTMAGKGFPSSTTLQPPNYLPQNINSGSTTFASMPANNPVVVANQERPQRGTQHVVSNLPIARKNSLHRFLEKRKDRISSKAPYLVMNGFSSSSAAAAAAAPAKPEVAQPWLGLAPQASN